MNILYWIYCTLEMLAMIYFITLKHEAILSDILIKNSQETSGTLILYHEDRFINFIGGTNFSLCH